MFGQGVNPPGPEGSNGSNSVQVTENLTILKKKDKALLNPEKMIK